LFVVSKIGIKFELSRFIFVSWGEEEREKRGRSWGVGAGAHD